MRRAIAASRPLAFLLVVLFAFVARPALAAWPTTTTTNVPVVNLAGLDAFSEVAVPDSCGGMIVAWLAQTGGTNQVQVQRLDVAGQPRWGANGFGVAPATTQNIGGILGIASDDAGGAFVTWDELRIAVNGQDVFVQHVLASGIVDPLWPPSGVPVASLAGDQKSPKIVRDGSGGSLIAWEDSRGNVDFAPDIFAQRVNVLGAPQWAPNGVPVIVAPGQQIRPSIAGDGAGGLFIAFEDYASGSANILGQHLEPVAGGRTWPVGGLAVCTQPHDQSFISVTSDLGRFLVAWLDNRTGINEDVYAQAISLTGVPLWTGDGVLVSAPPDLLNSSPVVVSDELGGAIIGWQGSSGGFDDNIVAQRVDPLGNVAWGASDVLLCGAPGRQLFMGGISDQRGGAIFFWDDRRIDENHIDIFARRITGAGTPLWNVDGNAVSTATGNQVAPIGVTDGAGGANLAWQDQRAANVAIFAQQIGASGSVGVRDPSKNCQPDLCGHPYTDFGDAPEGIAAFSSGAPGHYPTCITDSPPGTQEIACGAALSTPPGPTGYVEHFATAFDPFYFGFGCGPSSSQGLSVDSETDGTEKVGPTPAIIPSEVSACSPGVTLYEYETSPNGLNYGVDEHPGDGDAGIDVTPKMPVGQLWAVTYDAWACATGPVGVFLNVLVDWNHDGDWNDVVPNTIPTTGICAPEWAVKNLPMTLAPGCNHKTTPLFMCGPVSGATWMRMTLTAVPVSNDFPWRGSAPPPRSGDPGYFLGGETEDYPILQVSSTDVPLAARFDGLSLETPSPNPTSSSAMLRFSLPRAETVQLGVFDLVGRRVRSLDAPALTAGPHETVWDGRDEAGNRANPGLYFVRLRVTEGTITRAVVMER